MEAIVVAIIFISSIAIWFFKAKQSSRFPPGPAGFPIVGNLVTLGALPHQTFFNLSKKYGSIMMIKLGLVPTIVVSSAEVAREVLSTHDAVVASRPNLTIGRLMFYNGKDILCGPNWRVMKRICTVELFTGRKVKESESIRSQEISSFLNSIVKEGHNGKVAIDFHTRLKMLNTNVMSMMIFHNKFIGGSVLEYFNETLDLMGAFIVGDYIPFLSWLQFKGPISRMKFIHKKLDEAFQRIVDEHKLQRNTREVQDVVDVLLSQQMDDTDIKAMILDLLLGGSDTSAIATEWAISELIKNPKYMKGVQEEIDGVVGSDRMVTEADLCKLDYLRAVVKETFRLHPPAPLLFPHASSQECMINGYKIPKGATIFINVWAIGRDPNTWESPDMFNPERFMEKSIDVKGRDYELIPFGSGRRICPGISHALRMVEITLAHLVHAFEWKVEKEMLSMEEVSGVTLSRKFPFKAFAAPRLPIELY